MSAPGSEKTLKMVTTRQDRSVRTVICSSWPFADEDTMSRHARVAPAAVLVVALAAVAALVVPPAAASGHAPSARPRAACSGSAPTTQAIARISADSLIANVDAYRDRKVEVEGLIIHVCGVDGRKMKLQTDHGAILKIVPADSLAAFDESFYKKRVRVRGIAGESRVDSASIERMEKDKTLLCHIDHTPCKDSAWVNRQEASGAADSLSKRDIDNLKKSMEQTGKSYVPVITIFAEEVEIIEETKK
jgi:hypothetical protein